MKEIYQSDTVVIKRSQITLNPLNPKVHSEEQIKKQKKNIEQKGIFGGLVWNDVSGHLVAGHRRTLALDMIHKYDPNNPSTDYEIKVERVSLSETEEKEQMVFMSGLADTSVDFNLVAKFIDDVEYEHLGIGMDDYNAILELRDFDDEIPIMEMEMPKGIAGLREEFQTKEEKPKEDEKFYSNDDKVINPDARAVPQPVSERTESELLGEGVGKSASQDNDEEEEVDDKELRKNLTKINKEYTQDVAERRTSKLALIGAIRFENESEKAEFCNLFGIPNDFNITINAKNILELWQNHQK